MRHLDLFSGIGGFALAAQRAGYQTIGFCEIDTWAQKLLDKHWPGVPCYPDITKLKGIDVGPVDIITGGFPCQDISAAGRGKGLDGERSGLWHEYARIIAETKPTWIVIENSPRLRALGLESVLGTLDALGYDAEWHCIPASAVGAPHQRDRVWVIAHAQRLGLSGQGQLVTSITPAPDAHREANRFERAFSERQLPYVCGGHDGVSPRVDEFAMHGLGNALDPEIPFQIFQAINKITQGAQQ